MADAAGTWRVFLTDLAGNPLSHISTICEGKSFTFTANRPATFTFTVKSADASVASLAADGRPYLDVLTRGVLAYRCEAQAGGSTAYVLRFAGHVWQLEDSGDADLVRTTVTAYDPLQRLNKRLVRRFSPAGPFTWTPGGADDATYVFDVRTAYDGIGIATALVDRANSIEWTGLASTSSATLPSSGTAAANPGAAAGAQAAHFEYAATTDALIQLAEASNGFDFAVIPDNSAMSNGKRRFGYLQCYSPFRGSTLSSVLAYRIAPNNVQSLSRVVNGDQLANTLTVLGSGLAKTVSDATSQATYGIVEGVDSLSDVSDPSVLSSQANAALAMSKVAAQTWTIVPQARSANPFLPWDHFQLGDSFAFYAGPSVRGGGSATLRIYGFTLTVDDDKGEIVSALVTSPATGV